MLIREVKKLGGRCEKWGVNGWPDRMVFMPGNHTFFVELKREKGVLSPLQKAQHLKLIKLGYDVFVPYTKDDVKAIIRKLIRVYGI